MSNKSIDWRIVRSQMRNDRTAPSAIRERRLNPIRDPKASDGTTYLLSSWRGLSQRWYVCRPDRLDAATLAASEPCVVLAVARPDGEPARIVRVTADVPPSEAEAWIVTAQALGATEMHRHCLAEDARSRLAIAHDLTADTCAPARAA